MRTTIILIAAGVAAWLLGFALVWLYCVSAAREDRRIAASRDRAEAAAAPDDRDRPSHVTRG
ncbi:MAG TPA: hypothetical protein VK631_28805 [Solirubrobacteraceae bacterium]|nr:hypothetical protein [Solirubrobacteraceae bacterium]